MRVGSRVSVARRGNCFYFSTTAATFFIADACRILRGLQALDSPAVGTPMSNSDGAITDLLGRWKSGERGVEDELIGRIYPLLRQIAASQVRRNSNVLTLQATELANEAYSRLVKLHDIGWENRDHFLAIAATVIRRLVIDYLRQRGSAKRGGRLPFISIQDMRQDQMPTLDDSVDWIGLDEAMNDLARVDGTCARVVELKFFPG